MINVDPRASRRLADQAPADAWRPAETALAAVPMCLITVVVGGLLGGLAVAVDNMPRGGVAMLVLILASTGLSWGAAAVAAGAWSRHYAAAAACGALVLLVAVSAYYGGIALAGTRPNSSSASLLDAASIWATAGAAGGAVAGLAGWLARNGTTTTRSFACGGLAGLLMSQGMFVAYQSLRDGTGTDPYFIVLLLALIGLPTLALVLVVRRLRMSVAAATAVVVATLGAVAWGALLQML